MTLMMTLTCRGPTKIGNRGKNGETLLRGKVMPQELVNDQIGQIADLMPRAKEKARRVRRGKVDQRAE